MKKDMIPPTPYQGMAAAGASCSAPTAATAPKRGRGCGEKSPAVPESEPPENAHASQDNRVVWSGLVLHSVTFFQLRHDKPDLGDCW